MYLSFSGQQNLYVYTCLICPNMTGGLIFSEMMERIFSAFNIRDYLYLYLLFYACIIMCLFLNFLLYFLLPVSSLILHPPSHHTVVHVHALFIFKVLTHQHKINFEPQSLSKSGFFFVFRMHFMQF